MGITRMSVSSYVVATLLLVFILPVWASAENLVEAAKKEGKLRIIGGGNLSDMRKMTKEFTRNYPFLNVRYLRKHRTSIYEMVLREYRSGAYNYDVYAPLDGLSGQLFARNGLSAPYMSSERDGVPDHYKDRKGYWTGLYNFVLVYAYNTDMVNAKDVPRSYKDFLSPKWKGKLALHEEEIEWYASLLEIMGKEKANKFMRGLTKLDPGFRRSKSLMMQLLCAGEFALVMPMNYHHAIKAIKKGCPAKWVPIEPLVQRSPTSVALAKHPQHPAAGKLFINWILSKKAQEFMQANILRQSIRSDVEPSGPLKGLKGLRIWNSDWNSILENYTSHRDSYRKIFGLDK